MGCREGDRRYFDLYGRATASRRPKAERMKTPALNSADARRSPDDKEGTDTNGEIMVIVLPLFPPLTLSLDVPPKKRRR